MSDARIIEVPLTDAEYAAAAALASRTNRTIGELAAEAIRTFKRREDADFAHISELIDSIREDSVRHGTDKLSVEEIDEEIAAYRREQSTLARTA